MPQPAAGTPPRRGGWDPHAALTVVGGRTVGGILLDGASRHPDRPLLVYDPVDGDGGVQTFSWARMAACATALARQLARADVGPGTAVHVHLPNRPEFLVTWFAAALLGARMVPTNTASAATELAFIMSHAGARVSVTDDDGLAVVAQAHRQAKADGALLLCDRDIDLDGSSPVDWTPPGAGPRPTDDLAVMYTSGTTSRPKGVRVTHANYVFAGETVAAGLRLRDDDRFLTVLPLFHANAQYYSTMGTLVSGGTLILARRFSASRFADLAIRHDATVASLFSAPIRMILAQEPRPHWRSHRLRVVAFAQDLADGELARWDEGIGAPLLQLYGMTETIGPPIMNPLGPERRHDAIGRPVLGYRCRIVGEDGAPVAPGQPGELLVGGTPAVSLMAGYLDDAEATRAVLRDGWLRTGDLVREGDDGLIRFVGRTKDMIKRAGENVAAGEVESVLLDHPAVADAAVVGVPDLMRDEEIVAFVTLVHGADVAPEQLRAWCAGRLATFRVPGHICIKEDLPRTAVGKIQKHHLRASWADVTAVDGNG
jgi:crotonobetaine/carnitine-CoA ligase